MTQIPGLGESGPGFWTEAAQGSGPGDAGPSPPLPSCVTLSHQPTLSEPIFSLANGGNSTYYMNGDEDKMKISHPVLRKHYRAIVN